MTVELNFLAGRSGLRERPVGGDNLFNLFRFLGPVDSCCKPGPQTALTVSVLGTGLSSINGPRTHCWYYNDSSSKKTADAACLTLSDLPREAFVSTLAGSVSPQESPYRTVMAEIEFSVLARACLRGHDGDEDSLERAVSACVSERNAIGATINWRFTAQDARRKLHRLYPCQS